TELQDFGKNIAKVLSQRPDPYSLKETTAAREIHARLNAAVDALKELDNQGIFGKPDETTRPILLIEAGDREDEWALRLAQKINPPRVFKAYKTLFERPTIGTFTEFGTKRVYTTEKLAISADRRLVATATEYHAFLFDM